METKVNVGTRYDYVLRCDLNLFSFNAPMLSQIWTFNSKQNEENEAAKNG